MKTCKKCERDFPATLEYFYRDTRLTNGLTAWCKECRRKDSTKRRQKKKNEKQKLVKTKAQEPKPEEPKPEVPKFTIGQGVKVGNRYGRVYRAHKHFVIVDFKAYRESFNYIDIKLGQENIKIGGKSC